MWPFIWQTHSSSWSNRTKPEGSVAHANNYHMNEHCTGCTHVHTIPQTLSLTHTIWFTLSLLSLSIIHDTHDHTHKWALKSRHMHMRTHSHTQVYILFIFAACNKKLTKSCNCNSPTFPSCHIDFLPVAMRLMGTRCITGRFTCEIFGLEAPWPQHEEYASNTSFVFSCFCFKKSRGKRKIIPHAINEPWWGQEGGKDRVTYIQKLTMNSIHCLGLAAVLKDKNTNLWLMSTSLLL